MILQDVNTLRHLATFRATGYGRQRTGRWWATGWRSRPLHQRQDRSAPPRPQLTRGGWWRYIQYGPDHGFQSCVRLAEHMPTATASSERRRGTKVGCKMSIADRWRAFGNSVARPGSVHLYFHVTRSTRRLHPLRDDCRRLYYNLHILRRYIWLGNRWKVAFWRR